jgi:hypothetical protein
MKSGDLAGLPPPGNDEEAVSGQKTTHRALLPIYETARLDSPPSGGLYTEL